MNRIPAEHGILETLQMSPCSVRPGTAFVKRWLTHACSALPVIVMAPHGASPGTRRHTHFLCLLCQKPWESHAVVESLRVRTVVRGCVLPGNLECHSCMLLGSARQTPQGPSPAPTCCGTDSPPRSVAAHYTEACSRPKLHAAVLVCSNPVCVVLCSV